MDPAYGRFFLLFQLQTLLYIWSSCFNIQMQKIFVLSLPEIIETKLLKFCEGWKQTDWTAKVCPIYFVLKTNRLNSKNVSNAFCVGFKKANRLEKYDLDLDSVNERIIPFTEIQINFQTDLMDKIN